MLLYVHRNHRDYSGRGPQDGHLDFHFRSVFCLMSSDAKSILGTIFSTFKQLMSSYSDRKWTMAFSTIATELYGSECFQYLAGKSGRLTWVRLLAAARAALPIPTRVCSVFMCPNNQWHGCHCLGFLTCTLMLMHRLHAGAVRT